MILANPTANANLSHAKVLVVEDNDDQWVIIKQSMHQALVEVKVCRVTTTEEAVALLDTWQHQEWELPKFVLLDLYLPQRADGWQLLTEVKKLSKSVARIPIIIFSCSGAKEDIEGSYQLGASSYLVKPADYADWLAYFRAIRTYWWETVTLPPTTYLC